MIKLCAGKVAYYTGFYNAANIMILIRSGTLRVKISESG